MRKKGRLVKRKKWSMLFVRWIQMAILGAYMALFLVLPLWLLLGAWGAFLGSCLQFSFFLYQLWQGEREIGEELNTVPLDRNTSVGAYSIQQELCRRLDIPTPLLEVIESPSLNIAVYGFRKSSMHVVVTRGLLALSREELLLILAFPLLGIVNGSAMNATWFSRMVHCLMRLRSTQGKERTLALARDLWVSAWAVVPAWILLGRRQTRQEIRRALDLVHQPRESLGVLKRLESFRDRIPLPVELVNSALFLLTPSKKDPLLGFLMGSWDWREYLVGLNSVEAYR